MIVCHCSGVSDRTIREAVQHGARSCRQLALTCNAGRYCGGCRPLLRTLLANEDPAEAAAAPPANELPVLTAR